jgi:hypothetical protein
MKKNVIKRPKKSNKIQKKPRIFAPRPQKCTKILQTWNVENLCVFNIISVATAPQTLVRFSLATLTN